MNNIISIDVEHWFQRPMFHKSLETLNQSTEPLISSIKNILKILENHNKIATFFILGNVAETIPEIVEYILNDGHEIAFHGYSHFKLWEIGEEDFKNEVKKGVDILRHITRENIKGFRSPSFSLNKKTSWALRTIDKFGFRYDSSIFPFKTPFYGSWNTPIYPYQISFEEPFKENIKQSKIIELPILTRKFFNLRLPAGGGFYMRLFGVQFIIDSIKKMNKEGYPAMCYFHPWELSGYPLINMPIYQKIYAYSRIPCIGMFEHLVKSINTATAIETIENIQ